MLHQVKPKDSDDTNSSTTRGRHDDRCATRGRHDDRCATRGRHDDRCATRGRHDDRCATRGRHDDRCATRGRHDDRCATRGQPTSAFSIASLYCIYFLVCNLAAIAQGNLVFQPLLHEPRIYAGAPSGAYVTKVLASDDDGGHPNKSAAAVSYKLLHGGNQFTVENSTGNIHTLVNISQPVGSRYQVLVLAVSANMTQTQSLHVQVTRANHFAPQFTHVPYRVEIPFNTPPNTTVVHVTTTDLDSEPYNKEAYYSIGRWRLDMDGQSRTLERGNFSVDVSGGQLRVSVPLAQKAALWRLLVTAVDGGSPERRNNTEVEVHVKTITAPSNLDVDNTTESSARVCWDRPREGVVLGYLVRYRAVSPGTSHLPRDYTRNVTVGQLYESPGSATEQEQLCTFLMHLEPSTAYEFAVHGWNVDEIGIGSDIGSFNTPIARCSAEDICGNGTCHPATSLGAGGAISNYVCECSHGFYGAHCEHFNPCSLNPCQNLGACLNSSDDAYECKCGLGFYGATCSEFDPCVGEVECQHGGTCTSPSSHQYFCACDVGYYGERCERIDRCSQPPLPCFNGATCRNSSDGQYTCVCRPGFTGTRCEVDVDECQSSPCQNGGTCRDDRNAFQCLCPVDFQGPTCSLRRTCQPETMDFHGAAISFGAALPETEATLPCPYGPHGASVIRKCEVSFEGLVEWRKAIFYYCHTPEFQKAEQETGRLRKLTSDPNLLRIEDVEEVTQGLEKILEYAIRDQKIATEMVEVMSNLLNANETLFADKVTVNSTSDRLTHVMQRFVNEVEFEDTLNITTDNIRVHLTMPRVVRTTPTRPGEDQGSTAAGVIFRGIPQGPIASADGNYTDLEERGLGHVPSMVVSRTVLHMAVPTDHNQTRVRLHFVAHRNAKFYRERSPKAVALDRHTPCARPVFAINVANTTVSNVSDSVNFTMKKPLPGNWICVYWDKKENEVGTWSRAGLDAYQDEDTITCTSDHMTAFSILLDPDPEEPLDAANSQALSIISYIGSALSVLGLSLTILTYTMFRVLNRDKPGKILLNLCVSMLLLNVSFLSGALRSSKISSGTDRHPVEGATNKTGTGSSTQAAADPIQDPLCTAVAVLTHYFVMTTLAWMGVEAATMYQLLIQVFTTVETHFLLKRFLVAWGVPLVIVGVTAAVDIHFYSPDNESCMLSAANSYVYYFAFFGPCCLLLLANTIVFAAVTKVLFQPRVSVKAGLALHKTTVTFAQVRGAFTVMALLGVTWVFGALAIGPVRTTFQYVSCILNSLQGFLVFVFRCLEYPEARDAWIIFLRTGTRKKYRGSSRIATSTNSNAVKHSTTSTSGGGGGGGGGTGVPPEQRPTYDGCGNGVHPVTGTVFEHGVPVVTSSGAISWNKEGKTGLPAPTWVYGGNGGSIALRGRTRSLGSRPGTPTSPAKSDNLNAKEGRNTRWEYHNHQGFALTGDRRVFDTAPLRASSVTQNDLPYIEDEADREAAIVRHLVDRGTEETEISADVYNVVAATKRPLTKTGSHSDQGYSSCEHSLKSKKDGPGDNDSDETLPTTDEVLTISSEVLAISDRVVPLAVHVLAASKDGPDEALPVTDEVLTISDNAIPVTVKFFAVSDGSRVLPPVTPLESDPLGGQDRTAEELSAESGSSSSS